MEKIKRILSNPAVLIAAVILGGLTGVYLKPFAMGLKPLSDIYMGLLRMCVLPIVVCTITINIGNLFNGGLKKSLKKWLLAAGLALVLSAVIGAATGMLFSGFLTPDESTKNSIANMQQEGADQNNGFQELSFYGENKTTEEQNDFSLVDFLVESVPVNVFDAMTQGNTLQVILFFSILGIFLTGIDEKYSAPVKKALTGVYNALCNFINKLLVVLPFALYAMIAVQFSGEGMGGMLVSLVKLVLVIYLASLVIIGISFFMIQRCADCSLREHWMAVKSSLFISIGTGNCLATLPVAMEGASGQLKLDRKIVSSVLPIGITLCQNGIISCGAIAAVYATTLYDVPINFNTLLIIIVGSILFSISIIGVPGIVAVSMLSLILTPLGIPSEVIILIYLSTVAVFDPICVFASIYSNIAVTAFAAREKKGAAYES